MHIHMRLIISWGSPFTDCNDRLNPGYSQGGGSVTLSSTWFIIDLYTNVNHFLLCHPTSSCARQFKLSIHTLGYFILFALNKFQN